MVKSTQQWLNTQYGGNSQWNHLTDDGETGWQTIYGLIRGLQIELGITNLADNFGTGTMNAFNSQHGSISASTQNTRLITLLQGALWCKGYNGGFTFGTFDSVVASSVGNVHVALGLASSTSVSGKVLRSLMSMDAYVPIGAGTEEKRSVQRWLNGKYSQRASFPLLPCDGLFSRNTQQGMMYAVQYELNMTDAVANGNFGPSTRSGLQANASVAWGSSDSTKNWVRLYQGALRFNDYSSPFDGFFANGTRDATNQFQTHAALTVNGEGNFQTWASLLVSTGDETRPGVASDMATQLNSTQCSLLYANGYRTAGRYISVNGKRYLPGELDRIFEAGLKTFPIMQEANTSTSDFSLAKGRDHGLQAARRLRQLGFKGGTTVFFAVDFDALDDQITAFILPYFQGVNEIISATRDPYLVGVYGTRNVCTRVINAGKAVTSFVSDMSAGYSGNLGYRLPPEWSYDQIRGETLSTGSTTLAIDKNIQSPSANPVGRTGVLPTPIVPAETNAGPQYDENYYWYFEGQSVVAEMWEPRGYTYNGYPFANNFILHLLQRPSYWGSDGGLLGAAWTQFTPLPEQTGTLTQADSQFIANKRASYEAASSQPVATYVPRIRHWAASTNAYLQHGVPRNSAQCSISDLGAWALDLVSLWEFYYRRERASYSGTLRQWMVDNIGHTTKENSFGLEDLLGDVDAYLCAAMLNTAPNRSIADCIREIEYERRRDATWRYRTFHSWRFGGSRAILVAAAKHLWNGPPWLGLPVNLILGNVPRPSTAQISEIAEAFADAILNRA